MSVAGAADCAGCHRRTARKSYARLAEFGLIEDTGRKTEKGAKIWRIVNLMEAAEPASEQAGGTLTASAPAEPEVQRPTGWDRGRVGDDWKIRRRAVNE